MVFLMLFQHLGVNFFEAYCWCKFSKQPQTCLFILLVHSRFQRLAVLHQSIYGFICQVKFVVEVSQAFFCAILYQWLVSLLLVKISRGLSHPNILEMLNKESCVLGGFRFVGHDFNNLDVSNYSRSHLLCFAGIPAPWDVLFGEKFL